MSIVKTADEQRQDRIVELRRAQEVLRDRAAGLSAVAAHVEGFQPEVQRYRSDALQVANRLRKDAATLLERADLNQEQIDRIQDNITQAAAARHQERRAVENAQDR